MSNDFYYSSPYQKSLSSMVIKNECKTVCYGKFLAMMKESKRFGSKRSESDIINEYDKCLLKCKRNMWSK